MNPPPMIDPADLRKDHEHLRLLTIFHYIFAGFSIIGILFMGFHFMIMRTIFTQPEIQNAKGGPPPEFILKIMVAIYVAIGVALIISGVLNLMSAVFLKRRKHRMFSMIVAGIDCLNIPFGTALGVFTLIVLTRDTVRVTYND